MLASQLAAAISAARTTAVLDALAKATWSGHAGGHLSDEEAQAAAVSIEDRRKEFHQLGAQRRNSRDTTQEHATQVVRRTSPNGAGLNGAHRTTLFARARVQRPPDRAASMARRRHLAASGPMPPALAARFTTGELAVLRIVADEIRDKGRCDRTYAELAARAGVGRTTARNAVRRAGGLGFLHIEERPRPGRKHLANVVTITSREWRAWIDRRRPARPAAASPSPPSSRAPRPAGLIGVKKLSTTARRF